MAHYYIKTKRKSKYRHIWLLIRNMVLAAIILTIFYAVTVFACVADTVCRNEFWGV